MIAGNDGPLLAASAPATSNVGTAGTGTPACTRNTFTNTSRRPYCESSEFICSIIGGCSAAALLSDSLSILDRFYLNGELNLIADGRHVLGHAELGALERAADFGAAVLFPIERVRRADDARNRQRQRYGDTEQRQFALRARRHVAVEVYRLCFEHHGRKF